MKTFKIDGWRLDVANEVDHSFWREARIALKSVKKDAFFLGEHWFNASKFLLGDQFDSFMNYPLQKEVLDFFCNRVMNARQFCNVISTIRNWYPENVNAVMFNVIGSHDTPRILTTLKENTKLLKTLLVFHIFYTGIPCIYYGDEIGLTGEYDPGCRKCMEWNVEKQDRDLFNFTKKLISFRKENAEYFNGTSTQIESYNEELNYCLFSKTSSNNQKLYFLINNNEKQAEFNKTNFPILFQSERTKKFVK